MEQRGRRTIGSSSAAMPESSAGCGPDGPARARCHPSVISRSIARVRRSAILRVLVRSRYRRLLAPPEARVEALRRLEAVVVGGRVLALTGHLELGRLVEQVLAHDPFPLTFGCLQGTDRNRSVADVH